jgi:type II secretory ATPase GspE/PulE/Tfp pilus assembly ATPase PilB-like protein
METSLPTTNKIKREFYSRTQDLPKTTENIITKRVISLFHLKKITEHDIVIIWQSSIDYHEFIKNADYYNGGARIHFMILGEEADENAYFKNKIKNQDFYENFIIPHLKFKNLRINEFAYATEHIITYLNKKEKNLDEKERNASKQHLAFDNIVREAVIENASDIHFTVRHGSIMGSGEGLIEFRINGLIREYSQESIDNLEPILRSAYQSLADNDSTSENFNPKEKYLNAAIEREFMLNEAEQKRYGKHTDNGIVNVRLRVATSPIQGGYDVVMRIINLSSDTKEEILLPHLGYHEYQIEQIDALINKSSGFFLIAGITGSGKSTTLKVILEDYVKNRPGHRVRSIEEPVEYRIRGVHQTSVTRKDDKTGKESNAPFIDAIRAAMRLDPDAFMIGEIRDSITAELAVKAAVSGHMVISTVHAQSAISIFERLLQFGLRRDELTQVGLINGLVYQRLLQVVCPFCSIPFIDWNPDNEFEKKQKKRIQHFLGDYYEQEAPYIHIHNPQGCNFCKDTGIIGRTLASEIISVSPDLLKLIREGKDIDAYQMLRDQRQPGGNPVGTGTSAFEHAIHKMRCGMTDPGHVEKGFSRIDDKELQDYWRYYEKIDRHLMIGDFYKNRKIPSIVQKIEKKNNPK